MYVGEETYSPNMSTSAGGRPSALLLGSCRKSRHQFFSLSPARLLQKLFSQAWQRPLPQSFRTHASMRTLSACDVSRLHAFDGLRGSQKRHSQALTSLSTLHTGPRIWQSSRSSLPLMPQHWLACERPMPDMGDPCQSANPSVARSFSRFEPKCEQC